MSQGEYGSADISAWATAGATFLLAFVAVFQDWIRAKLWKPKLEISYSPQPPDAHRTFLAGSHVPCYFFLLRVRNSGKCGATNVEVSARRLFKKHTDGTYARVSTFLPQNIMESFSGNAMIETVAPGLEKHFTIGHVLHPPYRVGQSDLDLPGSAGLNDTVFSIGVLFPSNNKNHLLPPGDYAIEIVAGAANMAKTVTRVVTVSHSRWLDEEIPMVSDGVRIAVRLPGDLPGLQLPKE